MCRYEPRETVYATRLHILVQGVVARAGNIISLDDIPSQRWWGDILLAAPVLRDQRLARTLTYTETATLTRANLFSVMEGFPISANKIRQAALKLAAKRAILSIRREARTTNTRAACAHSQRPGRAQIEHAIRRWTSSTDRTFKARSAHDAVRLQEGDLANEHK